MSLNFCSHCYSNLKKQNYIKKFKYHNSIFEGIDFKYLIKIFNYYGDETHLTYVFGDNYLSDLKEIELLN